MPIRRRPRVSRRGVRFIARWEGFSPTAVDIGDRVLTLGYGTTSQVKPIRRGDTITKAKARRWLREILSDTIVPHVPRAGRLKQWELDALASAAYNLGPGVLTDQTFSTLARRLASGEARTYEGRKQIYRDELKKWVMPGSIFEEGLRRRRASELVLAVHGDYSGNRL